MKTKFIFQTAFPIIFLFFAGCGGPPAANLLLTEARSVYNNVQSDPQVTANAPVALEQAREYLMQSEAVWEDKGDVAEIEHYAYLAKQRALIAQEMAKINVAEEQVEQAEAERQRVLLEARTAQAEKAELEARQERLAAEEAKRQAETALARARELSDRITELEAQQTERGLVLTLSEVLFDFGQASLKPGAQRTIDELTTFLKEYENRNVLIEGFTDNIGSDEFNQDLSQRRALTVHDALIARGIRADRIRAQGYGENYPVATNSNAAGRQQNRRVEIIISDENGRIPARR